MPSVDPFSQHDKRRQQAVAKNKFAPDAKVTPKGKKLPPKDDYYEEPEQAPAMPWEQENQDEDLEAPNQYEDENLPPEQPAKTAAVDWDSEATRLENIANAYEDLLLRFAKYDQLADIYQQYLKYMRELLQYQDGMIKRWEKNKPPAPSVAVRTMEDDPIVKDATNKKEKQRKLMFLGGGVILFMLAFYCSVVLLKEVPLVPISYILAAIGGALIVKLIK